MALAQDIMLGGLSAGTARAIGGQTKTGISAAGTVITDATDLTFSNNVLSTVASGAGVQLQMMAGESQVVYNGGANGVKVYPPTALVAVNQLPVGTAHTLAPNTSAIYYQVSATQIIAFVSA